MHLDFIYQRISEGLKELKTELSKIRMENFMIISSSHLLKFLRTGVNSSAKDVVAGTCLF